MGHSLSFQTKFTLTDCTDLEQIPRQAASNQDLAFTFPIDIRNL